MEIVLTTLHEFTAQPRVVRERKRAFPARGAVGTLHVRLRVVAVVAAARSEDDARVLLRLEIVFCIRACAPAGLVLEHDARGADVVGRRVVSLGRQRDGLHALSCRCRERERHMARGVVSSGFRRVNDKALLPDHKMTGISRVVVRIVLRTVGPVVTHRRH